MESAILEPCLRQQNMTLPFESINHNNTLQEKHILGPHHLPNQTSQIQHTRDLFAVSLKLRR